MRSRTIIMILLAVFFGVGAIFAGQKWLDRQSNERPWAVQLPAAPIVPTKTIVVEAGPLRFGTELTKQHLREITWPAGAAPKGGFSTIGEVLDGQTRRVALAALDENEPILRTKVTGPGQRASLAALIDPAMKAVTVRVNDVNGVAGFVLPGERVDVLLTRNGDRGEAYADVLLQSLKVLAVDQVADDRTDEPALAKAVTLALNTAQAQKLSFATNVGSLSLVLRAAGVADHETTQRIGVADLGRQGDGNAVPQAVSRPEVEPVVPAPTRTVTVAVTRGAAKREEYSVAIDREGMHDVDVSTGSTKPREHKTVRAP